MASGFKDISVDSFLPKMKKPILAIFLLQFPTKVMNQYR